MSALEVVGCYVEGDHTIVVVFRKPCPFAQATDLINEYLDEPTTTTWNENLEGIIIMSVSLQHRDEAEAKTLVPSIAARINESTEPGAAGDQRGRHAQASNWAQEVEEDDDDPDVVVLGETSERETLRPPHEDPKPGARTLTLPKLRFLIDYLCTAITFVRGNAPLRIPSIDAYNCTIIYHFICND